MTHRTLVIIAASIAFGACIMSSTFMCQSINKGNMGLAAFHGIFALFDMGLVFYNMNTFRKCS